MLQSDSLGALQIMARASLLTYLSTQHKDACAIDTQARIKPRYSVAAGEFSRTVVGLEIVYLRHVRGHARGTHGRSKMNEICDGLARTALKQQMMAQ